MSRSGYACALALVGLLFAGCSSGSTSAGPKTDTTSASTDVSRIPATAMFTAAKRGLEALQTYDNRHRDVWSRAVTATTVDPTRQRVRDAFEAVPPKPADRNVRQTLTVLEQALVSATRTSAVVLSYVRVVRTGHGAFDLRSASESDVELGNDGWKLSIEDTSQGSSLGSLPLGTADVQAAVEAAGPECAALFSFDAARYRRQARTALAGLTGTARTTFSHALAAVRPRVSSGHVTYAGTVHGVGVEHLGASRIELLADISVSEPTNRTATAPTEEAVVRVTMTKIADEWLIGDLTFLAGPIK